MWLVIPVLDSAALDHGPQKVKVMSWILVSITDKTTFRTTYYILDDNGD